MTALPEYLHGRILARTAKLKLMLGLDEAEAEAQAVREIAAETKGSRKANSVAINRQPASSGYMRRIARWVEERLLSDFVPPYRPRIPEPPAAAPAQGSGGGRAGLTPTHPRARRAPKSKRKPTPEPTPTPPPSASVPLLHVGGGNLRPGAVRLTLNGEYRVGAFEANEATKNWLADQERKWRDE
jgi:hypothetical protein